MMPRRKQGRSKESAEGEPSETSSDTDSKRSSSPSASTITDESQSETVLVRRRKTGVVVGPRGMPALVHDWTETRMTASRGEVQPECLVGGGPIVSSLPCSGQRRAPPTPPSQQALSALGSVYGFKSANIESVLEGLTIPDTKRGAERSKSFSGILNSEAGLGSVTRASSLHTLSGYAISRPPKLTNPQVIEQHISKIISENAAIVETLDPLWSKRYMRHNGEAKTRRMSEGAAAFSSKLHSALLHGRTDERRSPLRESGAKNVPCTLGIEEPKQHPHNPEGSIIKDLLLKARAQQQQREDGEATDIEPGQVVYTCSLCSITFRSRENLDVHQTHYCKGAGSPLQTAKMLVSKRSSSFSYPGFFPRDEPGQILKKQLLGTPQAGVPCTPHKRRKISEPVFSSGPNSQCSEASLRERQFSFNSPFWNKPSPSPVSCSASDLSNPESCDVVASIAKPVLNSGGTLVRSSPNLVSEPSDAQPSSGIVNVDLDRTLQVPPQITVIDVNGNDAVFTKHSVEPIKAIPEVLLTPSSPDPIHDPQSAVKSETTPESFKNYLSPARPTSLPLKKKAMTMEYSTIVSPETPRPKRNCIQMFLKGQAYTSLYLKCSTRSTYCCLRPPQPMYVVHQPKLSMYSNWQVQPAQNELGGLSPGQTLAFYDSRPVQQLRRGENTVTTSASSKAPLVSTHSSYWKFRQTKDDLSKTGEELQGEVPASPKTSTGDAEDAEIPREEEEGGNDEPPELGMEKECPADDHTAVTIVPGDIENDSNDNLPEGDSEQSEGGSSEDSGSESQRGDRPVGTTKQVPLFQGGYKSNEDYTYIRGRGRGKYVCEECGIRCKKPSMLKKHIRTHTDLRPYSCSHCSFAFKTKGNLTKHMKSKAHHKKCLELGIVPVPTVIDDSQIDEAALAKQVANRQQFLDAGEIEDEDEDEDDDFDEDEEDEESEFEEEEEAEISAGQKREPEPEPSKCKNSSNGVAKKPGGQFEDATSSGSNTNNNEAVSKVISPVSQTSETFSNNNLLSTAPPSEVDQEAEAARSLLNLSDAWVANGPAEPEKREEVSLPRPPLPTTSAVSSPSLIGIPRVVWSAERDQGPKSRPRSYSVNVPPSRDPHTKVISYALPAVSEESMQDHGFTSRRYSMSALSESRRVILNCPNSSNMYARPFASSEKNLNSKEGEHYDKHWPMTNGSEQPIDLRVSKAPRLMLQGPQQALWNNSSVLLSPVNEHQAGRSLMDGSPYGIPFSENVASPTEYSPVSIGRFSPHNSGRLNIDVFPVKDTEEMNGELVDAPNSPEAPEYSALSPISPASVDGDSQPSAAALDEMTAMAVMDSKVEMSARQVVFNRMNNANSKMEEGKCVCSICNKTFSKPSQLRLHVNIHYFERPFRCESCAVSFRTKGHLQKHKRSVSHYNKVNMNMTFGTPTTDNPRPFKCEDCKIAFRIHGHLAKHLRSKMHIMKLECLGKLPFGMYAEMERSGVNLNEIDTTDCENSLESLQVMAQRLYQQEPRRMRWQSDHQSSTSSKEDRVGYSPSTHGSSDEALGSPPVHSRVVLVSPPATSLPAVTEPTMKASSLKTLEVKVEPSEEEILRLVQRTQEEYGPPPSKMSATDLTRVVAVEKEIPVLHRSCTCHLCGRLFKSMKFLQVHLHYDHQGWSVPETPALDLVANTISVEETTQQQQQQPQPRWVSPLDCNQRLLGGSAAVVENLNCEICGRQFTSHSVLQQHLLSHAQLRPFVCEVCDAGFTSSVMLSAHLASHTQEKPYMCHECGNTFAVAADFQRHMQAHLNDAT